MSNGGSGLDLQHMGEGGDANVLHENPDFLDSVVTVGDTANGTARSGCAKEAPETPRARRLAPKLKAHRDILWQEDPERVLKYRPDHLHYYGWMPLLVLRNLKAMVLSNVYLHLQGLALLGWVAALHTTGLYVPKSDLASFLRLFGTPYAGAIFNMSMLITFILGLFVTLVVNRWSTIKQTYSRMTGATLDLCMLVASTIQDPCKKNEEQTLQVRTELTRLLNLGHILAVSKADSLDRNFKPAHAFGHFTRTIYKSLNAPDPANGDYGFWSKKPRNLEYADLVHAKLINKDEWCLLEEVDRQGLPKFQVVYYWAQALLHRCKAEGWIVSDAQMLPMMLNKLNVIVESGSQMFTTISSQMPYPYVHLVSFVVHVYLLVTATWYGAFLHVGFPVEERFSSKIQGEDTVLEKGDRGVGDSYWTVVWCYFFVILANVMFQGLLDMHSLLDNPFGMHCTKFPLRAQSTNLMNATTTLLVHSQRMIKVFGSVFCDERGADRDNGVELGPPDCCADRQEPTKQQPGEANCLNCICPKPRRGVVPTIDSSSSWQRLPANPIDGNRIQTPRMEQDCGGDTSGDR